MRQSSLPIQLDYVVFVRGLKILEKSLLGGRGGGSEIFILVGWGYIVGGRG